MLFDDSKPNKIDAFLSAKAEAKRQEEIASRIAAAKNLQVDVDDVGTSEQQQFHGFVRHIAASAVGGEAAARAASDFSASGVGLADFLRLLFEMNVHRFVEGMVTATSSR